MNNEDALAGMIPDVSRETYDRLEQYSELVLKWNPTINLISKSSINQIWERHILDSAQIFSCVRSSEKWADLGSGGGFPGIVAAVLAFGSGWTTRFTLVESDQRKAAFLRNAGRELGLNLSVTADRIEQILPMGADVLTARALAPLSDLLGFASRHLVPDGIAIFPKGRTAAEEVLKARQDWVFDLTETPSKTDPDAKLLMIKGIARAET